MSDREVDRKRCRRIELEGDWVLVVGKNAQDNDFLSLQFAEPNDMWFHVYGYSGSHAIIMNREGEEPPRDVINAAASVAAYYSKARNVPMVKVGITHARYVGKRKGAPAGEVTVKHEKVIKVKPELPES